MKNFIEDCRFLLWVEWWLISFGTGIWCLACFGTMYTHNLPWALTAFLFSVLQLILLYGATRQ